MNRSIALLLAALLFAPAGANAQTWSAAEQELIEFTQACWDSWGQEQVDAYLAQCWEDDISFWWAEYALPFGKSLVRQDRVIMEYIDRVTFDMQVHAVTIHDDTAVIHYQIINTWRTANDDLETWTVGRTDMLHRHDGQWKVLSVHSHLVMGPG